MAAELLNVPNPNDSPAPTSLRHVAALGLTGVAITMNTHAASERILFDFQAPNDSPAWQIVNDDVMGGVSTSRFQILTNGGAVFSGVVSLENNGGFASVRSAPARYNLMTCGDFVIRLRGDGRRYTFTVRTEPGFNTPLYQCAFVTKRGEWEEHRLAFKDFVPTFRGRVLTDVPRLNPGKVTSVGLLISESRMGHFNWRWRGSRQRHPRGIEREQARDLIARGGRMMRLLNQDTYETSLPSVSEEERNLLSGRPGEPKTREPENSRQNGGLSNSAR